MEVLQLIRASKGLGFTLDEVGEVLTFLEQKEQPCRRVREIINRKIHDIDDRIAHLQDLRRRLEEAAAASAAPAPGCPIIQQGAKPPRTTTAEGH